MAGRFTIATAQELVRKAYGSSLDKSGNPVIDHPRRIAQQIKIFRLGAKAQMVAWLHDAIEDEVLTFEEIRDAGAPDDVMDALDAISRRRYADGSREPYEVYLQRVCANEIATMVKWFDFKDNLSEKRMKKLPELLQHRLRTKWTEGADIVRPSFMQVVSSRDAFWTPELVQEVSLVA